MDCRCMPMVVAGLLAGDVDCIDDGICHYGHHRHRMVCHKTVDHAPLISDKLTEYNNIYSVNRSDRKDACPVVMGYDTWHG